VAKKKRNQTQPRTPWRVHFFRRHKEDDPKETSPAFEFLEDPEMSPKVEATFHAILDAVAAAPPPAFSGGGKWEAMHGSMAGYYEARVDGPHRRHYRLFCVLERDGASVGLGGPSIVAITGMAKAFMTTFTEAEYAEVRALGREYRKRVPRSVVK
jgi:Txe/YoeB family toxin of Txe-Axe toxin-antitoxin module